MRSGHSKLVAALGVSCLVWMVAATFANAEDAVSAAARISRPLAKEQVSSLFNDKTWHWKDGAAYFSPKSEFWAWAGAGARSSYAEGTWSATQTGQLCFTARWHTIRGSRRAITCFEHHTDGKAIYQRRLPQGSWYIFGHEPVQSDDEAAKLTTGNDATSGYEKNKDYVMARKYQRSKRRARH